MEQYGNETRVERVLRENITGHEYMRRTAREMNTWEAIVDEIYRAVDHVEPWMSGNIRGPSSAFCLLMRLFELKLTEEQIQDTITCKDSDYIRAIGFLYLRYVCQPHNLQSWLEPHLHDESMFWPSGDGIGQRVSMGAFVTDLVLCQNYFETIFTRLPKKIVDEFVAYLKEQGLPCEPLGNGGQGGPDRRGGDDGRARPASVKASLSVAIGQRAPNRAGVTEDVSTRYSRREDMAPQHGRRTPDDSASNRSVGTNRRQDEIRAPRNNDYPRARPTSAINVRDCDRDRQHVDHGGNKDWRTRDRESEREGGRGRNGGRDYTAPRRRDDQRDWNRSDRSRDWQRDRLGDRPGDRRAPAWRDGNGRNPPADGVFGRSAADVFGMSAAASMPADDVPAAGAEIGAVRIGRPRR